MAKRARIFLLDLKNTWPEPYFFDLKQKQVDLWPDLCFLRVNPTRSTRQNRLDLNWQPPNPYLAVGGRSLPSQIDSGKLDGGSSLLKPDPPDPTVYITQFLVILYSPLQFRPSLARSPLVSLSTRSLNLASESHALDLSHT